MADSKKWVKPRHEIIGKIVYLPILLLVKLLYHVKLPRYRDPKRRPCLILANHQTDFDQFFVFSTFRRAIYFVAMEDIFSMGFVSKLISWAVAPIPIKKASTDIRAVMNCMRVAKQGGTICIFPEGNRTYSGRTCYIKPSIAALAKSLKLPVVFYKIEGGYGIKPRWAGKRRSGSMSAGVSRVIEPEELKQMSDEELYDVICRELYVDESASDSVYPSSSAAEYIERMLYVCPECGLSEFTSRGNSFSCRKCGKTWNYLPDMKISCADGSQPVFQHAADWYDYQESFIRALDLSLHLSAPAYSEKAGLYEVIVYEKKQLLSESAEVRLYGDRIEFDHSGISGENGERGVFTMAFDDIAAMGCIADHKLNIFYKDKIYQLRGDKGFNALKYCNFYYHAKFLKGKSEDGKFQFLGL